MRIRNNVAWILAGNVIYMGCQWAVLIAIVKLGDPDMTGQFSFAFAVCAPICLLSQLRLRAASATDVSGAFKSSEYIWLRLCSTVLAVLATGIVCFVSGFPHSLSVLVMIVALAKAIESGSDLLYGFRQRHEQMRPIAVSMSLRGLFSASGFALLLCLTRHLVPALLAFCFGWLIVLVFYDLPRQQGLHTIFSASAFHASRLLELGRSTFPLGLSAMLMSLAMNIPRYFLEHSHGNAELGMFSAVSYLTLAGAVVVNSIAEGTVARFAVLIASGDRIAARKLLFRLVAATLLVSLAGIGGASLVGNRIIATIYRADYSRSPYLLVLLMVGAAFSNLALVYNYLLLAMGEFKKHLMSLVLLSIFMTASCAVLIPRFGALGAGISLLIAFSLQLGWCAPITYRLLPRRLSREGVRALEQAGLIQLT